MIKNLLQAIHTLETVTQVQAIVEKLKLLLIKTQKDKKLVFITHLKNQTLES